MEIVLTICLFESFLRFTEMEGFFSAFVGCFDLRFYARYFFTISIPRCLEFVLTSLVETCYMGIVAR